MLYCLCQSTKNLRYGYCKFVYPIHNFKFVSKVDITAINTQPETLAKILDFIKKSASC